MTTGLLDKKEEKALDPVLEFLSQCRKESEQAISVYHQRWAKNLELVAGRFSADEVSRSKVRNRSKLFFRKIWSNNIRLLAALYQAFLKDPDGVKVLGRMDEDETKAALLQVMVEYRRDWMMRTQSLFRRFVTGFLDILECGLAPGLLLWKREPDGPFFRPFPPEQVFPDMSAETPEDMAYVLYEDFLTETQMRDANYENMDKVSAVATPYNVVRSSRHPGETAEISGSGEKEYPKPGQVPENAPTLETGRRYRVFHAFYRREGELKYAVVNGDFTVYHVPEKSNPYGKRIPGIFGICLPLAHKLAGEGFPEPQEGSQISFNDTVNRRKDNVALFMNRGTIVSRFGNVDIQSLLNSRPGGVTVADDVEAVKERQMGDVTQSAYVEAASEDGQMQELSGVTDIKLGAAKNEKATTAAINQSEAGAKIDFFIAMVAETYMREFYSLLAYEIQKFETDKKIFRVANERLRKRNPGVASRFDMDDVDDFEADVVVEVGPGTVGRELEIRQTFLAMDRAIMANQSTFALLKAGTFPKDGLEIINVTQFWTDFMKKIGHKDTKAYVIKIPPPQKEAGALSGAEGLIGGMTPQAAGPVGMESPELAAENELQSGGSGG